MKKRVYLKLVLFVVISIGFIVLFTYKRFSNMQINYNNETIILDSTQSIYFNWKDYTNNKLGFAFQYPPTLMKIGNDVEVVDLLGNITAVEINLIDTISKATLLIGCHFAPNGIELYNYVVSKFETSNDLYGKDSRKIKVAGNDAFEVSTILNTNGKGNLINPPLRLIVVDFLDNSKTIEIQLQFKTPLTNEIIEVEKFRQLLSSFKFIN